MPLYMLSSFVYTGLNSVANPASLTEDNGFCCGLNILGISCILYLWETMLLKDIEKNFPYISVVQYGGQEYVGIIINQDQFVTSMYVYTILGTFERKDFLNEMRDQMD